MCLAAKLRTENVSYPVICMSVTNSPRNIVAVVSTSTSNMIREL